jgi:hypothetical protein
MSNLRLIPGIKGSDGGPPEDPMVEQRVSALEEKFGRIESVLQRLEPAIREIALTTAKQVDLHKLQLDVAELKGRMTGLEGKIVGVEGKKSRGWTRVSRLSPRHGRPSASSSLRGLSAPAFSSSR